MGVALRDRGEPDEAIACYRRALEFRPDFADVHYNLGTALNDPGSRMKRSPATAGRWS